MKIDTGSSASFASFAALAAPAFLVWAALAASFAAAAASSFGFASALAVSSWAPRSTALAAGFCLRSSARALAGLPVRHEQRRMGELDRLGVIRRDDHAHPDPRFFEQLLRKAIGHPHAAVRGRISGQRPAMQRDAVPGDALHVRHPGIVIEARVVVLVLLEDGENAGWRLASL